MVQTSSKWVNLDFDLIFDLEGHNQLLHETLGTLTKLFCTFGPNLVIQAWKGPKIYHADKQVIDTQTDTDTHRHTHIQMQATTIPEGQNWPQVKIIIILI